jgi:tripartite motif-containing protein 71
MKGTFHRRKRINQRFPGIFPFLALVCGLFAFGLLYQSHGICVAEGVQGGEFYRPSDVAVGGDGRLYVGDESEHCILLFDADGKFIKRWGDWAREPGPVQFNSGIYLAFDSEGVLYASDSGAPFVQKFRPDGELLGRWKIPDMNFGGAHDIEFAPDGSIYLLCGYFVKHLSPDGTLLHTWGGFGKENGLFQSTADLDIAPDGSVYVLDWGKANIQKFTADGRFLSVWGVKGTGLGQFQEPYGYALAADGSFYVSDSPSYRIQHFDVQGNLIKAWGGEGTGPGQFRSPKSITIAPDGNLFIADKRNNRIQKFSPDGTFIWQLVGAQPEW